MVRGARFPVRHIPFVSVAIKTIITEYAIHHASACVGMITTACGHSEGVFTCINVNAVTGLVFCACCVSRDVLPATCLYCRNERLMMMVFRRWGHFYLALSNQALRKRTRERNQARNQVLNLVRLDSCEGAQGAKMAHE